MKKHISTIDWRLVGKFLEMATKIYEMRLESIYNDAVQTNRALKINIQNEPNVKNQDSNKEQENRRILAQAIKKSVIKSKSSKVTQNPEILNKHLEVHAIRNPILFKLTTTIANRSKDMLINILSSSKSALTIPGNSMKFWDSKSQEEIDANEDLVAVHDVENLGAIRTSLEAYIINSSPLESLFSVITIDLTLDDSDDDGEMENLERKKTRSTFRNCDSGIDVSNLGDLTQFDTLDDFDVKYDAEAPHEEACNFSQDQTNEVNFSMMPTTAEEFEYSYQSKEFIENHWAGPSYWKFNRKLNFDSTNGRRSLKRHKSAGIIHIEDVLRKRFKFNDTLYDNSTEQNRLNSTNIIYRRKTLPMDFEVSPDFVNHFSTLENLDIDTPISAQVTDSQCLSETEDFGLTAMGTQDSFDAVPKFESTRYFENFKETSQSAFDDPLPYNLGVSTQLTENFSSFSIESSQFTPKVTSSQYQIPNHTQKVSNIKDIKRMCEIVLESEHNLTSLNGMKFTELTKKTTKMLEGMHTSTALNFQAILHLGNENKLEIHSEFSNIDDFFVSFK